MAVSDEYREFVLEQLEGLGELTSKRMFSGVGIWCDGVFFAIIADNILYLKADETNRHYFEDLGMEPFRVEFRQPKKKKEPYAMGYWEVPADVLENTDELEAWALRSLEVALRHKDA